MSEYVQQGRKYNRDHCVATPSWLARRLHTILRPVVRPHVVLDPCVGTGQLLEPWYGDALTVGMDTLPYQPLYADWFYQYPFDLLSTWSHRQPDLILCNPPFNGTGCYQEQMMFPELFLRQIVNLFGSDARFVLFAPHGFRMNLTADSKRFKFMQGRHAPEIMSIATIPRDTFPEVQICSEIMFFNIPGLKPHYWLGP